VFDVTCEGEDWHDPDGELFDCDLYVSGGYCGEDWVDEYPWCGMTADQACCGCMDTESATDNDRNSMSRSKSGGYIHPFASSNTRESGCPGEGPDVGCDGVCFSDLIVDACGECGGTEENADSCCWGHDFQLVEGANSPQECEDAAENDGYEWIGCYEDPEEYCIDPGCYYSPQHGHYEYQAHHGGCDDGDDGPPECMMDCPGIENLDGDDICTWVNNEDILDTGCLDDCDGEDSGMLVWIDNTHMLNLSIPASQNPHHHNHLNIQYLVYLHYLPMYKYHLRLNFQSPDNPSCILVDHHLHHRIHHDVPDIHSDHAADYNSILDLCNTLLGLHNIRSIHIHHFLLHPHTLGDCLHLPLTENHGPNNMNQHSPLFLHTHHKHLQ
jgi:hypothetical protein